MIALVSSLQDSLGFEGVIYMGATRVGPDFSASYTTLQLQLQRPAYLLRLETFLRTMEFEFMR